MTIEFLIGVIAGLITVAIVLTIMKKVSGKDCFSEDSFDERQAAVRGKAYKYAFYTDLSLSAIWMIVTEFVSSLPVTTGLALFIIMMISVTVYAVYSIMNDAYFGMGFNIKRYFIFMIVIIGINLAFGIMNFFDSGIALPYSLGDGANLTIAVTFLPVFIAMGMKLLEYKREDKEENDEES